MEHPTLPPAEGHQLQRPDLGSFGPLQLEAEAIPARLKYRRSRIHRTALVAAGAGLLLTACAGSDPAGAPSTVGAPVTAAEACTAEKAALPENPVIAATATSAEPRPALPMTVVQELTTLARGDHACVTVVGPDGHATNLSLTPFRSPGQVERGPRRDARERANLAAVQDAVGRLAARAPDLDTRALIARVTRIHSQPTTVYVLTSGVSTVAPTDLRQLGWDTDGAAVGSRLRDASWLPDLGGWSVRFVGIGDVAGAQPQLTDPVRERLAAFWLGICRAAGAHSCTAEREYVGRAAPTSVNPVPVVDPPSARVDVDAHWLPASALFSIGRADVSPGADRVLRTAAERINASGRPVTVIGHTDATTGTDDANLRLSLARAEAVRQRLIDLGVPADRILAAFGVGSRGSDVGAERRDPRLIDRNRNVEIRFGTR